MHKSDILVYEVSAPRISERWEAADILVRSISLALENWLWAPFEREAVAVVCNELLENSIKYGDWGQPRLPSFFLRCFDDRRVQIETSNVTNPSNHARFRETLADLTSEESAKNAYQRRAQEIAMKALPPNPSTRIGLLRLAHENRCRLSGDLTHEGVLSVRADLDLNWMWGGN